MAKFVPNYSVGARQVGKWLAYASMKEDEAVDIHLRCGDKRGIIEVKRFVDAYQLKQSRQQAARYAQILDFDSVTIAMFVPVEDETVLEKLSSEITIDGVLVTVVAIGWT